MPENSTIWIKRKVFEKLNKKKKDHPKFKDRFDEDFKNALENMLKDDEHLKSNPSEVSDVEGSRNKWEGWLVNHIFDMLHLTFVTRDLGLE